MNSVFACKCSKTLSSWDKMNIQRCFLLYFDGLVPVHIYLEMFNWRFEMQIESLRRESQVKIRLRSHTLCLSGVNLE